MFLQGFIHCVQKFFGGFIGETQTFLGKTDRGFSRNRNRQNEEGNVWLLENLDESDLCNIKEWATTLPLWIPQSSQATAAPGPREKDRLVLSYSEKVHSSAA
ncbi:hypothetical protein NC652_004890 [Populus alba x Populus x berolinensis]|nr:hypothetical protein NC652_004890 [Populus alba x Populus x berolinensis]